VFRILLAEDNPGDVLLFQEALKGRNLLCEIVVAEDGHKAITILKAAHSAGARMDLIVLDVNLPKHNGDAVLREVRGQDSLADIPVIMLTSSASPADKAAATKLGANLYIQKSSDLEELMEVGKVVEGILRTNQDAHRQPD
jgi:CheY-like chemotaxis protein